MKRLGYFTSIEVPDDLEPAFKALEDILQREHGIDGSIKIVTPDQNGFMTSTDKQRIDELWATHLKSNT